METTDSITLAEPMQLGLFDARPPPRPIVITYGGGLDSFAMLLLAIITRTPIAAVVFCDVADKGGLDPGEWPGTYRHLREVVIPLCERAGIPFVWLDTERYPVRDARSLFAWLKARQQIPVAGPARICTVVAKVERFERWLDDTFPGQEVEVWVGFEAGEENRAAKDPNAGKPRPAKPGQAGRLNRFVLIEARLCRCRCELLVRALGHPVPNGSACMFCPYASKGEWQLFARMLPWKFSMVEQLEADKPVTARGFKLSIMGFRKKRDAAGNVISYRAPPLSEFIQGAYRPKVDPPCEVCGMAPPARKRMGCGWADEPADYLPAA